MDGLTRAQIRACKGVYRPTDTARHFGVTRVTVRKIWSEPRGIKVEPPNIWDTSITADLVIADTQILLDRGHTLDEAAKILGCSVPFLRSAHKDAGIRLDLPDVTGSADQRAVRQSPGPVVSRRGAGGHTTPGGEVAA